MKKRILSALLVTALVVSFCGASLAAPIQSVQPKAAGMIRGGLAYVSGNTYNLWATITGLSTDQLSVRVVLYRGSTYITQVVNGGLGPYVMASTNVVLSAGTYTLNIYGTTSTDTLYTTKTVII